MTQTELGIQHLWLHLTPIGDQSRPVVLSKGRGCYVYDVNGNEYLDALSGNFCVQVGYGRSELIEAASQQLQHLPFCRNVGLTSPPTLELAAALAELSGLDRVFFTSGGSEAVESAMKLVRQYFHLVGQPKRTKFIAREMAYHGATLGALSLTGVPSLKTPFEPLLSGVVHVPLPPFTVGSDPSPLGDLGSSAWIRSAIEAADPDTVAAVVLEPVQVTAGPLPPHPSYLPEVQEICREYGVLLISDEVVNAFGRLGAPFAFQRFDFSPDVVTVAKGLTSGYVPAGAVLVSAELASAFAESGDFFRHILTYGGHPVASAVALENLAVLSHENLYDKANTMSAHLETRLSVLLDHPLVGGINCIGLLAGIELVSMRSPRTPLSPEVAGFIQKQLFEHRLLVRVDTRAYPIIQIAPPLICTDDDIDRMLVALTEVLEAAEARLASE